MALAEHMGMPVENLMTPELIRRVLWEPPDAAFTLREVLNAGGARPWQIEAVAPILEEAIRTAASEVTDE
jgi:ribonuclease D